MWSDRDQAIASIISSLESKDLWQCYFHDFIKIKCTQSDATLMGLPEETILPPLLSNYFKFEPQIIEKGDYISHLAWLHVHSEIHKTDLNQMIDKLKRLKGFITPQPQETLAIITQTMITAYTEKNLEVLIIRRSYASLCDIFDNHKDMIQWYTLYRDIVRKIKYLARFSFFK